MDDLKDAKSFWPSVLAKSLGQVFWSSLAPAEGYARTTVFHFLKKAVDDASSDQRGKISAIYLLLFAINGAAWAWAVIALADRPTLPGHRRSRLCARAAPRRGRRSHRLHRQCRAQADAGRQEAGRGWAVFSLGHSLVDRGGRRRHRRCGICARGALSEVEIRRQHHRHRRVGVFSAGHRRHQSRDPARRVAELSARAPRAAGRRPSSICSSPAQRPPVPLAPARCSAW